MHKRKTFKSEKLELTLRDTKGSRIYMSAGKPEAVILQFLHKFEGFGDSVNKLGIKIDKRHKNFKKLFD